MTAKRGDELSLFRWGVGKGWWYFRKVIINLNSETCAQIRLLSQSVGIMVSSLLESARLEPLLRSMPGSLDFLPLGCVGWG